jgi:hypothetical protein
MSGFVPQPDLRGCRLGIEIEIQIEIVIRGRVGQFDFDADFDFDDDQVGVRLCGSEANNISACLLGTLYTKAICDYPGALHPRCGWQWTKNLPFPAVVVNFGTRLGTAEVL